MAKLLLKVMPTLSNVAITIPSLPRPSQIQDKISKQPQSILKLNPSSLVNLNGISLTLNQ